MADELSVRGSITFAGITGGAQGFTTPAIAKTISMTGTNVYSGTQDIGTTEETVTIGEISTLGYILILNLDSTNFVEVGLTGSYTIKMPAGGFAVFPANGTIYAKADTAICKIQVWAFEE